jgi:regulator of replication initiation timing
MFAGKTGFTHFVQDLDALQNHIRELAEENRRLRGEEVQS